MLVHRFFKVYYYFYLTCQEWDTDPMVPFPPVVEPNLPGAFITNHPKDVINSHGNSLPWMTGLTSEEGAMKSARKYMSKLINY